MLEVWRQLHREKVSPTVLATQRQIPSYNNITKQELRRASYEVLYTGGLDQDIADEHAKVVYDTPKYVVFAGLKTSPYSPFDCVINCFPHEGNPITHTVDEISENERGLVFDVIERGIKATVEISQRHDRPLGRIYVEQHLGPGEVDHMHYYRTAYPQTHFHVYGLPLDFPREGDGFSPSSLKTTERTTYYDPTCFLAYDFMRHEFPAVDLKLNKMTSTIEVDWDYSFQISPEQREFITSLMIAWKKYWQEVADCYTNFKTDKHGRLIRLPMKVRLSRVNNLISHYPILSPESKSTLIWLAKNLQRADFKDSKVMLSHFFKSFAGSWSVLTDVDSQKRKFVFAPRTFVMSQRAGATDGYVVNNERGNWISSEERIGLVESQKELVGLI